MKKIFAVIFLLTFASSCSAIEIKIPDWKLVNEFITPLIPDATSEDLGRVIYRTYEREAPREILEIILTEGKGTGSLYVPEEVDDSKKLMPASEYKILELAGHKAILEIHENLPPALAVRVDENIILNLESPSLTPQELISIAEKILEK